MAIGGFTPMRNLKWGITSVMPTTECRICTMCLEMGGVPMGILLKATSKLHATTIFGWFGYAYCDEASVHGGP